MLRSTTRRAPSALRRALSTANGGGKPPSVSGAPAAPDAVTAAAKKSSIGSSTLASPSSSSATPSSSSSSSSSGGSFLPKLLLLGVLTAPGAAAVYVNQNPTWNPEVLRGNENWIQFRELALGGKEKAAAAIAGATAGNKPKPAAAPVVVRTPAPPAKTPEEFSEVITKGQKATTAAVKKEAAAAVTPAPISVKKTEGVASVAASEPKAKKKTTESLAQKVEKKKDEVVKAVVKAEQGAEKAAGEAVKKVVKAEQEIVKKGEEAAKKVVKAEQEAVKKVTAAVMSAQHAVEKKIDEAAHKAREEIDKLAAEASAANMSHTMEKKIHAATKEVVDTLRADSDAAADDIDKNYLNGLHELDANALVIRVAQLATEMKHRSKWEAARLLEALRVMEENAQKKSAEVLRRQEELHKELVAKELRLQEEILTRKTREETEKLKKSYAEDLARNVNAERATILNKLQETFTREKKIIEDRYAQQLRSKSKEVQEILAKERSQRVLEMENYRAQLRALNTVLENSSTYEAFSHQVHKVSVAALALSDRIEAAAPLRAEIRALRDAARSDEFIEVAVKSLPQSVIDEGAPSVSQLQERFNVVKKVAHRAALAPENSGLVGQLFGAGLSFLIIPPGGPIEGKDTDAVFSRADYALKAGDIESAVKEMKALSGVPAQVSKDWISAAESRLAVEQTAKVVKAHVALLAESCS